MPKVAGRRRRSPRGDGRDHVPRLRDVAEQANVSTATVSRVVNNPESVTEEVRQRVQAVIDRLNWVPNASAKALATSRTHTIGAIMPTLEHQNFTRIVSALQTKIGKERYELLLGVTDYQRDLATQQARNMIEKGVEALVLVGADHPDELLELLDVKRLPHVLLYVMPSTAPSRSVIGFDNSQAFARITRHLLGLGHRNFGLIAQDTARNDRALARKLGVTQTLANEGRAIRPRHYSEGQWTFEDGMRAFEAIMSTEDPPTAIICGNDYLAVGCILKAAELGIDIPGDVSVTGFDDIDLARLLRPRITTMKVPDVLVGELAADYLMGVLKGKEGRPGAVPEPELIVRESTAAPKRPHLE